MTTMKGKQSAKAKTSVTVRATEKAINNCKSIAEKKKWSFSQTVVLAMEAFKTN